MKKNFASAALLIALMATACKTTTIVTSWRKPGKQIQMESLKKVLVVAFFTTEAGSHKAEDQMAAFLKGKGVVSYKYLGRISKNKEDSVKEKIKHDGFDGAITMRLTDKDKELDFRAGMLATYPDYFQSFTTYYYRNQNAFLTQGHFSTTTTYSVETNIYSIKENKIIWTGLTKTTNPDGVEKLTADIVSVLYKKMLHEGFISSN